MPNFVTLKVMFEPHLLGFINGSFFTNVLVFSVIRKEVLIESFTSFVCNMFKKYVVALKDLFNF